MNIVALVVCVVSAFFLYKLVSLFLKPLLPDKLWAKPVYTVPGLGLGLLYLYFAGYFVMAKDANMPLAFAVALAPLLVYLVVQLFRKAKLIED